MTAVPVRVPIVTAVMLCVASACSDAPSEPASSREPSVAHSDLGTGAALSAWLRARFAFRGTAEEGPPILVGAGDIARCYDGNVPPLPPAPPPPTENTGAEATAKLLDRIPGTVITIGDNAYQHGSTFDFEACYDPTWGRHKDRTRPSAGNHEYLTPGAAGYFAYFGLQSAPPLGYYSYNHSGWHVVVLNSTPQVYLCWPQESDEVDELPPDFPPQPPPPIPNPAAGRACAGDLIQQAWLVADLTQHSSYQCTVVYFHHPRFSSGKHGNHYQMQRIWDILYAYGVDVVLSAHDHLYERFAPQDPDGNANSTWGIRQFTVGTGGAELYGISTMKPNSEVFINTVHGVLTLGLGEGRYGWAFVAVDGSVRDFGTGQCHGAPTPPAPTL
jgi:hypothetical protein